ncbi:MAG: hypothetical protein IAE99_07950 [Rhodothermales bacterium]|nr:hypothetical protein [Rhodothermales bacterium]
MKDLFENLPAVLAAVAAVLGPIGAYWAARRKRGEDREDAADQHLRDALAGLAEVKAVNAAQTERIAYLDRTLTTITAERDALRAERDALVQHLFEVRLWGREILARALAAGATNLPPEPQRP